MPLTLGVEEEFHLVDRETRHSVAAAEQVLRQLNDDDAVVPELKRSVVESNSAVCTTLGELAADLARLRGDLVAAADRAGVVASGSVPLVDASALKAYPKDRYARMSRRFATAAQEQVVCGVQTQVGIADRELAVQVL